MKSNKDYFLVASRGLTATTWFSNVLGLHPNIFCSHGRDKPDRGVETEELLNDSEYRKDRLEFEQKQRKMDLNSYLSLLSDASSEEEMIIGNVHGFILPELLDKLSDTKLKNSISIANMVRHPVTFIESYTSLYCHRESDYPEKFRKEFLPRIKKHEDLINDFNVSKRKYTEIGAFIDACQSAVKMSHEINSREEIPTIRMEKIVSEPNYFLKITNHLTNQRCEFDDSLLNQIFEQEPLNSHRSKTNKDSSPNNDPTKKESNVWAEWSSRKKSIFHKLIQDNHLKKFTDFGYDCSFLS